MQTIVQEQEPLSHFTSNPSAFLEKLRESGEPLLLTVEGKGELIVQDVASYRRILQELDRAQTIAAVREALEDVAAGRTRPMQEVFDELAEEYGFPQPKSE